MTGLTPQAKVGLFVVAAAIALIYMTIRVGGFDLEPGGYRLFATLENIAGLEEAAKVKVAGVTAGKVEKIELKEGKAKLTLYILPGVVLHNDSTVTLRSMGMLGEKYVEITPGSPDQPVLKDGDTLYNTKEGGDFEQLAASLSDVAKDIKAVSSSMRSVLGGEKGQESIQRIVTNTETLSADLKDVIRENREQLHQIVGNINRLSANLENLINENRQSLNKTVDNVTEIAQQLNEMVKQNRTQIEKTIANLEKISQTLNNESPRLAQNANKTMEQVQAILDENRQSLRESMAKIQAASEKLDKTLASAGELTQKVERGEGTLGKLFKDDSAYNNLNDGLKGLKGFFDKGKDLQVYLGVRSEYLFRESDAKTYLTLKLQPRPDKYYLVEVVDDPRGYKQTTTTKRTTGGTETTIKEEETKDKLKFSVQFAKKFYDFTLRGGLIESTGGLGLDYEPWGVNKVKFSAEIFDFSKDNAPHLKFTTNFYIQEQIFLNAGVDDIADKDFRTVFMGVGILFSDQDLKALLGGMAYGAGAINQ